MVSIPNVPITEVPSETGNDVTTEFPSLQSITVTNSVGPLDANRQHNASRQRTLTLRDRANKLIQAVNAIGDTTDPAYLPRDGSAAMTAALPFGGFKGINLADPTSPQDASTKAYTDAGDSALQSQINDITSDFVRRDGTLAMTAAFNFGGFKGINLGTPTANSDAANKIYVDNAISSITADVDGKVDKAGDTMTGNLVMDSGATVTGLPTPANPSDAASKAYVDAQVGALSIAIQSAGVKNPTGPGGGEEPELGTTLGGCGGLDGTAPTLDAGGVFHFDADLNVAGGAQNPARDIYVFCQGNIVINSPITGSGVVVIKATGNIEVNANVVGSGGVEIVAGGALTAAASASITTNNNAKLLTLEAAAAITLPAGSSLNGTIIKIHAQSDSTIAADIRARFHNSGARRYSLPDISGGTYSTAAGFNFDEGSGNVTSLARHGGEWGRTHGVVSGGVSFPRVGLIQDSDSDDFSYEGELVDVNNRPSVGHVREPASYAGHGGNTTRNGAKFGWSGGSGGGGGTGGGRGQRNLDSGNSAAGPVNRARGAEHYWLFPMHPGGGGGGWDRSGGDGGGAVNIYVDGTVTMTGGSINANATSGSKDNTHTSGGGGGGAVRVVATVEQIGGIVMHAKGGNAQPGDEGGNHNDSGAGGGGSVAVISPTVDSGLDIETNAGSSDIGSYEHGTSITDITWTTEQLQCFYSEGFFNR